jgi:hypothetical protein
VRMPVRHEDVGRTDIHPSGGWSADSSSQRLAASRANQHAMCCGAGVTKDAERSMAGNPMPSRRSNRMPYRQSKRRDCASGIAAPRGVRGRYASVDDPRGGLSRGQHPHQDQLLLYWRPPDRKAGVLPKQSQVLSPYGDLASR